MPKYDENGVPRLNTAALRYALLLYDRMFEQSKLIPPMELLDLGFPQGDQTPIRVFKGFISRAGTEVGLSKANATQASTILYAMRAATMLKASGGRNNAIEHPSIVLLSYLPTHETFLQFKEKSGQLSQRIAPSKTQLVLNELAELKDRVAKLESIVALHLPPSSM